MQDELGLNITAMDFRMYDNAIGRFYGIDVLAELMPSITPNNFAFNNPVYFSDPTGLLSQSFIDGIWNNSAANSKTTWINDGNGNFDNADGSGFVNSSGEYFQYSESLPEVTITLNRGYRRNESFIGQLQSHVYSKGKYYQGFRDRAFSKQVDELQSGLDWLGTADPTGIIDGINALTYLARGQRANAAIAAVAILPFGDLAKGTKLADKAHTVYTGVKDGLPYVGITSDLSKRYSADEIAKYGITPLLENVPGRNMARGIEQNLINHHGLENMANKINSISPKNQAGKHSGTMERATQYLNSNLPGWNN